MPANVLQAGVRFLLIPDTTFEQPCAKNGTCLLLAGRSRRPVYCPFFIVPCSPFVCCNSFVRGRTENVLQKCRGEFGFVLVYLTKLQIVRVISKWSSRWSREWVLESYRKIYKNVVPKPREFVLVSQLMCRTETEEKFRPSTNEFLSQRDQKKCLSEFSSPR